MTLYYTIINLIHYSNSHYLAVFFIPTLRWSYRSRSIVCITYRFKDFSTLGLITNLSKTRITKRVIRRNLSIQPWLRWSPTQMYLYLAAKLTLQVCTKQTTKTILPYYLQCNCICFQSQEYSSYLTFSGPIPSPTSQRHELLKELSGKISRFSLDYDDPCQHICAFTWLPKPCFLTLTVNQKHKSKFRSIWPVTSSIKSAYFSIFCDTNSNGALSPMVTYMQSIHNIRLKII